MGSEGVREILGRKRTVEILEYLSGGEVRNYSDIEEAIDTSSVTVTESLALLRNHGLVERNEVSKKDVRYEITARGETFLEVVRQLENVLSDSVN